MKIKQVILKNDITIIGLGKLKAGTALKFISSNKRYVYLALNGCTLKLNIKEVIQ